MASSPITAWQIEGEKVEIVTDFLFLGSNITVDHNIHEIGKKISSCQESYDKPRECAEKQRNYSAGKCLYNQGYGLPSGRV